MKIYALLISMCMTFASQAQVTQQEEDMTEIRLLYAKVSDLAQRDLRCEKTEDCAVVPVGQKACGGPTTYVIASHKNERFNELMETALLSKEKENDYNIRYGVLSTCSIVRPPFANCLNKVCQKYYDN